MIGNLYYGEEYMNKDKLKELVKAFDVLSDDIKDMDVNRGSINEPLCGTPCCHAGLISIVAKDLPELQDIYNYNDDYRTYEDNYEYDIWADTLAEFLGFVDMCCLRDWVRDNPKLWGNKFGQDMFYYPSAFVGDSGKKLTHIDIINHWKQVLANIEKRGKEMKPSKLKEFVNALDLLSDDVKDWDVNMISCDKPSCDTCGCHAGLICLAAQELPEMQDIYTPLYLSESGRRGKRDNQYIFYVWSSALAIFLGFKGGHELEMWADNNPKLWGNKFGRDMFCGWRAFTDDEDKQLNHRDIINHWKQVLANIES